MSSNRWHDAVLLDAGSNEKIKTKIRVNEAGILLSDLSGLEQKIPFSQVSKNREFSSGFSLTVEMNGRKYNLHLSDEDALRELFKYAAVDLREDIREFLEHSASLLKIVGQGAAILIVLFACGWGLFQGTTAFSRQALLKLPPEWEVKLGTLAFSMMSEKDEVVDEQMLTQTIQEITVPLLTALGESPYEFKFHVIASPTVNALSLPGGNILIYTGLIEKAESPDELAGILAHEISHVTNRHSLQALGNQLGMSLFFTLLPGVSDSGLESLAPKIAGLSFSRSQEEQADAEGLKLINRAGFNSEGMFTFFRRMSAEEGSFGALMSLIATHPSSEDRLNLLQQLSLSFEKRSVVRPKLTFSWEEIKAKANSVQVDSSTS